MAVITIIAEENCVASAIVGSMDAFAIANLWGMFFGWETDVFQTRVVTMDGKPVTANGGFKLEPQCALHKAGPSDVIILPAFLPPFDLESEKHRELCQWLRQRHAKGECIAATCTGTFLLARTGLLDHRTATTNWQFAGHFRRLYPLVDLQEDQLITRDDNLICTGAASAFLNMCLDLMETYGSSELASHCSRALLIDPERQSQAPYMLHDFMKNHGDEQILLAQRLMEEKYSTRISVDDLAGQVGISPRHFQRRFKTATGETPLAYLQHVRIEQAKKKLETTTDTVNEITWNVGYDDINSFRRLFKKNTGMSPKGYRTKFSRFARPGAMQ